MSPGTVLLALSQLAALFLLAATAYAAGRLLTWRWRYRSAAEELAISGSLGLGALSGALFLLGLAGLLWPPALWALFAAVHLGALPVWREVLGRSRGLGLRECLPWVAAALLVAPFFALTLYPPTDFDAVLYHLPTAKAFAREGRLAFLPTLRFPVFPHLNELLFAGMLSLAGERAAQGVHFLEMLLAALALFALGRRLYSTRAGLWAAAIWLGNPLVPWLGGAAYADLGIALFGLLAVGAFEVWRREGEGGWLALSGAFAGFAASTKYTGLFFVAVLGFMAPPAAPRGRRRAAAAAFLAVAVAVAAPHYGRIAFHTGNPLFPYFTALQGGSEWETRFEDAFREPSGEGTSPALLRGLARKAARLGKEAPILLTLPWRVAFDPFLTTRPVPLSAAYLALLPLALALAWRDGTARRLLGLSLLFVLCYGALLPPYPRFLLPAAALTGLACAAGLDRGLGLAGRRWGWIGRPAIAVLIALVLFAWGLRFAAYKIRRQGPVPGTAEERDAYLARKFPAYPALVFLNRRHGEDYAVYALFAEELAYFADGAYLGDRLGPARYQLVLASFGSGEELFRTLRRLGADHFLYRPRLERSPPLPEDEAFGERFRPVLETERFVVFELQGTAGSGP